METSTTILPYFEMTYFTDDLIGDDLVDESKYAIQD